MARRLGLLLCVALCAAPVAHAARGDLRYFKTYPEAGSFATSFNAAAVQPDGMVVVVGTANQQSGYGNTDWVVARLDPSNGALDPGFGTGGVVKIPIDLKTGGIDDAYTVAIGPGGRILVAGDAQTASGWDMAIVALTSAGDRDTGFGPQGLRTLDFGSIDRANSIIVDDAGTVTVGGLGNSKFALARLDSSGQPVPAFGGGKVTTQVGSTGFDEITRVLPLDGGGVLAVGTAERQYPGSDIALVRYDATGAPTLTKRITSNDRDDVAGALIDGQRIDVADSVRDANTAAPRTEIRGFALDTFDAVAGYGGPTLGDPSLFGAIAPNPAGGLLAAGIGPFGSAKDDWRLAFVGADGLPSGTVFNYPSSADKQEFANALLTIGGPTRLSGSDFFAFIAGIQEDVAAAGAVELTDTGAQPTPTPTPTPVPKPSGNVSITKRLLTMERAPVGAVEDELGKVTFVLEASHTAQGQYPIDVVDTLPVGFKVTAVKTYIVTDALFFAPNEHEVGGLCNVTGGTLSCHADLHSAQDFGGGEQLVIVVKGEWTALGTHVNSATASSTAINDSRPDDNTATLTVNVRSVFTTIAPPTIRYFSGKSKTCSEPDECKSPPAACDPATSSSCTSLVDCKPAATGTCGPAYSCELTTPCVPEDDCTTLQEACGQLPKASGSALKGRVQVAVLRVAKKGCKWLASVGGAFKARPAVAGACRVPIWLTAKGTSSWKLKLRKRLPRGRYVAYARTVTASGLAQSTFSPKNRRAFKVR